MPPLASSNLPIRRAVAPVKCPLLVAKQLRFKQVLWDRGTVGRNEWAFRTAAVPVGVTGDDLLPGPLSPVISRLASEVRSVAPSPTGRAWPGRQTPAHAARRRHLTRIAAISSGSAGQAQELGGPRADRDHSGVVISSVAIGDHRYDDPLPSEYANRPIDVQRRLRQQQVRTTSCAQLFDGALRRGYLAQHRAPTHRDANRGRHLFAMSADNQHISSMCYASGAPSAPRASSVPRPSIRTTPSSDQEGSAAAAKCWTG